MSYDPSEAGSDFLAGNGGRDFDRIPRIVHPKGSLIRRGVGIYIPTPTRSIFSLISLVPPKGTEESWPIEVSRQPVISKIAHKKNQKIEKTDYRVRADKKMARCQRKRKLRKRNSGG